METIYLSGGCLWGVQAFVKTIPGVIHTEAGRANGQTTSLDGPYDGYVECVKTTFDPEQVSVEALVRDLFDIIDPYAVNRQGYDVGPKYRTGVYSENKAHLNIARQYIAQREDYDKVQVEVCPLTQYVPSAAEHQDRLDHFPDDYCHIPHALLHKYQRGDRVIQ